MPLRPRASDGDDARRERVQHCFNRPEAWPVISALSCAARSGQRNSDCRGFKAARQSVSSVGGERAGKREDGLMVPLASLPEWRGGCIHRFDHKRIDRRMVARKLRVKPELTRLDRLVAPPSMLPAARCASLSH